MRPGLLFIVLLFDICFSEFPRREPYQEIKGTVEISDVIESGIYRNIGNLVFCFDQAGLCISYTENIHILHGGISVMLFKYMGHIIRTHGKLLGNTLKADLFCIVLVDPEQYLF